MTERPADLAGFLDAHLAAAYRLARAVLREDGDAEDAVQEACLIAWRKRTSLRDPERLEAWFDRIVLNLCRDRLRRRKRIAEILPAVSAEAGSGQGATSRPVPATSDPIGDLDMDLDAALDALDFDHRVVVLLRYWQDRTVEDIASRLDLPAGTVKSRLHYALRTMRRHLEAPDGRA